MHSLIDRSKAARQLSGNVSSWIGLKLTHSSHFSTTLVLRKKEKSDDFDEETTRKAQKILDSNNGRFQKFIQKSSHAKNISLQDQKGKPKLSLEMQDLLEKANSMTPHELQFQKFLDGDKPFMTNSAEDFIVRKNLIRDLPDTIDLSKPETFLNHSTETMADIRKIYEALDKLDGDQLMHNKYYERYGFPVNDIYNEVTQGLNGIKEKFRSLRREESRKLPLKHDQYRMEWNLFRMPYNVVGFDTSITGLPLNWKINRNRDLPLEMVQDLEMFKTTVPIRKRDVDFESLHEYYERNKVISITVHPDIDTQAVIDDIKINEKTIEVSDLNNYNFFPLRTDKHISLTMNIIYSLRKKLYREIEREYSGVLMFPNAPIKKNEFRLLEKKKPHITHLWNNFGAAEVNLPIQLQELEPLPLSVYNVRTRKEVNMLRLHLFKLFMINLEEPIEHLIRVKYQSEEKKIAFLKHLSQRIYDFIDKDILHTVIKSSRVRIEAGGYIYQPFIDSPFKRIVWGNKGIKSLSPKICCDRTIIGRKRGRFDGTQIRKIRKFQKLKSFRVELIDLKSAVLF